MAKESAQIGNLYVPQLNSHWITLMQFSLEPDFILPWSFQTGVGKSATANTLLGDEYFQIGDTQDSQTEYVAVKSVEASIANYFHCQSKNIKKRPVSNYFAFSSKFSSWLI